MKAQQVKARDKHGEWATDTDISVGITRVFSDALVRVAVSHAATGHRIAALWFTREQSALFAKALAKHDELTRLTPAEEITQEAIADETHALCNDATSCASVVAEIANLANLERAVRVQPYTLQRWRKALAAEQDHDARGDMRTIAARILARGEGDSDTIDDAYRLARAVLHRDDADDDKCEDCGALTHEPGHRPGCRWAR